MCMALGGRVAESIIFNRISSGARDDLEKVTKMAYAQIKRFGMDEKVGLLSFPDEGTEYGQKPYSKKLAATMDVQARLMVSHAYKRTEKVLADNKDKLKLLAETLLKKEVLNYADVETLIGVPPFGPKKIIEDLDLGPIGKQNATKQSKESKEEIKTVSSNKNSPGNS